MNPSEVFVRHKRIAFQFSGGRDSLAALFALRSLWHRMTIYHLNHGDQYPEIAAVVEMVGREVPIVTVASDVHKIRTECGLPTDLLPADNTGMGRALTGRAVALQGRFDCCTRAIMAPLHQRMLDDGITLIVRGVRATDFSQDHEYMSGHVADGIELYYPIESWSDEQVNAFVNSCGIPLPRFYLHGMREAPECMGCTAWWGNGANGYLRAFHPKKHEEVQRNIALVRSEIDRQFAQLKELDHG
jgi:3'-phosphoadenosine 5'-phosphosulfate sulfotransferase (PAPS reductase)/FAD synthetase